MAAMQTLEIRISRGRGGVRAVVRGRDEVVVDLDLKPPRLTAVQIFEDWLRKEKVTELREVKVLGEFLYEAVFHGGVKQRFDEERQGAIDRGERLLLELNIDAEEIELASLPWEFLHDPQEGFLATHENLILTRTVSSARAKQLEPPTQKLNILVVTSQPHDVMTALKEEWGADSPEQKHFMSTLAAIVEQLSALKGRVKPLKRKRPLDIVVEEMAEPTIESFRDRLMTIKPDIVHYIGHGSFKEHENTGCIALLKTNVRDAEWCLNATFAEYFRSVRATPPRLVFLHLCKGPRQYAAQEYTFVRANFAQLASELIRSGVQAVVAMQYPMKPDRGEKFTRDFYEGIKKGKTLATAVQEARNLIRMGDPSGYADGEFATPVLYMRSSDGLIVPISADGTESTEHAYDRRKESAQRPPRSSAAAEAKPSWDAAPSKVDDAFSQPVPSNAGTAAAKPSGYGDEVSILLRKLAAEVAHGMLLDERRVLQEVDLLMEKARDKKVQLRTALRDRGRSDADDPLSAFWRALAERFERPRSEAP
jgi:CHAT domain-containing protein